MIDALETIESRHSGERISNMLKRLILAVVGTACAFPLAGCGNSAGLVPVSGKVLYKGEPASGAVVYFQRQGIPGAAQEIVPFGIVQDDGGFSLSCDGLGDGALPGSYAVLVEWRDEKASGVVPVKANGQSNVTKRVRIHAGPDRLKGRYFDASKPLLHAEVKPGPNPLASFELKD
jgi:hypothetical protein